MHVPECYMDRFPDLPWDRRIMAAMISAVDDGVGEITDTLKRLGLFENTIIYFQSDNGPSRESRNWLDGTEDPYYGGTTGIFSGHKFSLFEGGIRIPALLSWGNKIKPRTIDKPFIAMDLFPTVLEACGGNTDEYVLDGKSMLSMLISDETCEHDYLFWEMEDQNAVRYGDYKLVLNGRLTEGEAPRSPVFLSDLRTDPGEKNNLAGDLPELCENLTEKVLAWRKKIEETWTKEFAKNYSLDRKSTRLNSSH